MTYCPFCKKHLSKSYIFKHLNIKKCLKNQIDFKKKYKLMTDKKYKEDCLTIVFL